LNTHNTNKDNLKELISLYLNAVNELSNKLLDCLKIDTLCNIAIRKEKKIPIKGKCEKHSLKYAFHGIGCYIKTPNIEVEVDFDDNCSLNGFDVWRIWCFLTDNMLDKKFDKLKNKDFLENVFFELESEKSIDKKDNLYYLSIPVYE
jgi:hypothetical protein